MTGVDVAVSVNGELRRDRVPARLTLADYLREVRGRTGTHLGCEQGVCGACTVLVDGASVRSCLMFAAQADGSEVSTVEGLAADGEPLGRLQRAFADRDALQCGFCTPGLLMACRELLAEPVLDDTAVREAVSGNLCRCTGYDGIVTAVLDVHAETPAVVKRPAWSVGEAPPSWAVEPSAPPVGGRRDLVRRAWRPVAAGAGVVLAVWLVRRVLVRRRR
ncbi:MAG: 2Fe-2S iron-sulfur cluster binding domain-containing protein [Streptosporangiales bacterium]|nr:2Fe-2S iron-sulfur cluster binding domain-containing protein [Streptosporangiales bacterium]